MNWELLHPQVRLEMLGFLPNFLKDDDPRPAREQLNERYSYGWHKFDGHRFDPDLMVLKYPGDPPMLAIAQVKFRNETVILFECAWVVIVQEDGTYEIARMD